MKGQRGEKENVRMDNATEREREEEEGQMLWGIDAIIVLFHLYQKPAVAVIERGREWRMVSFLLLSSTAPISDGGFSLRTANVSLCCYSNTTIMSFDHFYGKNLSDSLTVCIEQSLMRQVCIWLLCDRLLKHLKWPMFTFSCDLLDPTDAGRSTTSC